MQTQAADIEVEFDLPPHNASASYGVVVLANEGYVPGGDESVSRGVLISLTVHAAAPAAAAARGSSAQNRLGVATISAAGAAPCVAASPYCSNSTQPQNGERRSVPFSILSTETTLALRVVVDRVLVRKTASFLSFPYVCPEPVLVK